jgi:phosphoglycolate phosphatase-like HAD superfamily hydrolase
MILKSAEKWNIDISKSWIIGDTTRDILTGKNAGMRTILVKTGKAGLDGAFPVEPDYIFENILEAVNFIVQWENQ